MSKSAYIVFGIAAVAAAGAVGYYYIDSDGYKDGQNFKTATAAAEIKDFDTALPIFRDLYETSEEYKWKAKARLKEFVRLPNIEPLSNQQLSDSLANIFTEDGSIIGDAPDPVLANLTERIAVGNASATELEAAVDIYELINFTEGFSEAVEFDEINLTFIKRINALDPTNLEAALELFELHLADENFDAVKTVLTPVKDSLGDTEAARVLAELYLNDGNTSDAYLLLSDYTKKRLVTLNAAETEFLEFQNYLWEKEIETLQNGNGPSSFYRQYDLKSPEEQGLFVDEYVSERIEENPVFQDKLDAYSDAAAIVPIAMDFGILQIGEAQRKPSQEERETELKAAEETFLAIRNVAGDSDDFKLYLGQVYYWLGKQSEGQALFDEVIAGANRSPEILLTMSGILRTLGQVADAKRLASEAYESAKDVEIRYSAASMMHVMATDIDDSIDWLEKSDPNSSYVQANLSEFKGHRAFQQGDRDNAQQYYRTAIRHFEAMPDDSTNFNNTALAYFSLHLITGNVSDFNTGVELMSKAVQLRPDDAILLGNVADVLITKALFSIVGNEIDYAVMESRPSLNSLSSHYSNEAEKQAFREQLIQNKDFNTAISHLERNVILSPNNLKNYSSLISVYSILNDGDSMMSVVDRMTGNDVDTSEGLNSIVDSLDEDNIAKRIASLKENVSSKLELASRRTINDATRAALYSGIAAQQIELAAVGEAGFAEAALENAERAVKLHQTSTSRATLVQVLITNASLEAASTFPNYADVREQSYRVLTDESLVTLTLAGNDDIANWLKNHPNVKRASAMEAEDVVQFPKQYNVETWAFLEAMNDPSAEILKTNFQTMKVAQAWSKMGRLHSEGVPYYILTNHWTAQLTGDSYDPTADLEIVRAKGIELPSQLF